MTLLDDFFQKVNRDVDGALDLLVPGAEAAPAELHQAMRWSLFAGGKRVRPALLFAAGSTFGAPVNKLQRSAAAVEMVHTYSLIHDDLPAMDDDDLRRGKATCHIRFGEATAILAGDALQTLAFKAIAEDKLLTAETRVALISVLAEASGTPLGMVSGQQLDLSAEGKTLILDEVEQIHRQKTGALIWAATTLGAMIGGATADELVPVTEYAARLGLLFQITDDLLDVTGETATLGKTAGKDTTAEKATYPALLGLEAARETALVVYHEACNALADISGNTGLLEAIAGRIISRVR